MQCKDDGFSGARNSKLPLILNSCTWSSLEVRPLLTVAHLSNRPTVKPSELLPCEQHVHVRQPCVYMSPVYLSMFVWLVAGADLF
jgi:hypothetical protein